MSGNLRRPFSTRINLQPVDNSWLVILLIILLVFFWGFAVYVEGVDGILMQEWLRGNAVLSVLADLPAVPWIPPWAFSPCWSCCSAGPARCGVSS